MEREIRRCQDHLISIGTGVSLFGIWTVIRIVMSIIVERRFIMSEIQKSTEEDPVLVMTVLCLIAVLLSILILSIHLYIGLSARREGLDEKKRTGYLIVNGLFIIIYCIAITAELICFRKAFYSIADGIITIFIDITMLVTLVELMFNAVRVRKLSGQLTEKRV